MMVGVLHVHRMLLILMRKDFKRCSTHAWCLVWLPFSLQMFCWVWAVHGGEESEARGVWTSLDVDGHIARIVDMMAEVAASVCGGIVSDYQAIRLCNEFAGTR